MSYNFQNADFRQCYLSFYLHTFYIRYQNSEVADGLYLFVYLILHFQHRPWLPIFVTNAYIHFVRCVYKKYNFKNIQQSTAIKTTISFSTNSISERKRLVISEKVCTGPFKTIPTFGPGAANGSSKVFIS